MNSACIYRTLANLLFAEMFGVPTSLLRNGVDDEFGMWLKSLPNDYHIRVFVQRLARKFHFYLLRSEHEDGICAMPVSKTLRHFFDVKRKKFAFAKGVWETKVVHYCVDTSLQILPCERGRGLCSVINGCLHTFCKSCIASKILIRCLHSFCKGCIEQVVAQYTILLNLYALGHGTSRRVRSDFTLDGQ